jgi:hypothetical protein
MSRARVVWIVGGLTVLALIGGAAYVKAQPVNCPYMCWVCPNNC